MGAMFVGFYEFAAALGGEDAYNVDIDDSYATTFDKTTNISDKIDDDYNEMINWSVDKTSYLGLTGHGVSLIKNMISLPFALVGDLVTNGIESIGLPSWVQSFLLAAIAALLVFAVLALILRYRYT